MPDDPFSIARTIEASTSPTACGFDAVTPGAFIGKWRASELKERSASQEHFIDLCRLLGEPTPAEADPAGERYCFERGARKDTGGGWADVWKRGCFGSVVSPAAVSAGADVGVTAAARALWYAILAVPAPRRGVQGGEFGGDCDEDDERRAGAGSRGWDAPSVRCIERAKKCCVAHLTNGSLALRDTIEPPSRRAAEPPG